ncbi:hypothetical protein NPIL_316401 [Nephila pilipes]|uniref:Serine/threonine-protein phosphatase PGAM5, mitochondrial n=1 Tax=Nephila pilipes TaxID=299642 RepID=A0A8X6QKF1_NEPPI|nr:hypothetical protein NPIL_316401 [Nephila pilipes]
MSLKVLCVVSAGSAMAFALKYLEFKGNSLLAATSIFHQSSHKWIHNWDRRDASSIIKPHRKKKISIENMEKMEAQLKPTATRHIFLIRHGNYYSKEKEAEKQKLTSLGLIQADLVGQHLRDLKLDFSKITHSTMIRAEETSKEIQKYFPDVPVEKNVLLEEGFPIQAEPVQCHFDDKSIHEDGPRIEAAFRKYFHRADASQKTDSYEIIVCHGNVIRYFLCRLLQVPPEFWLNFTLLHCSMSRVSIDPEGYVNICAVGEIGFMPRDIMT